MHELHPSIGFCQWTNQIISVEYHYQDRINLPQGHFMAKVIISYSRKDIEFAKKLTDELQKNDLNVWVDWEDIPPTVDWWLQIEKGIEEADAILFVLSPNSIASKICGQELDHTAKNNKRLIPLLVHDIKGDEAPPQLGHLNWIFFREDNDFAESFNKLLTAIQTDYAWVQSHSCLQTKALEWERHNHENSYLLRGKDLQDAELQLATNSGRHFSCRRGHYGWSGSIWFCTGRFGNRQRQRSKTSSLHC